MFVVHEDDGVRVGLYIDRAVLERLDHHDPLESLDTHNLHDFCTALEGVSHFHYLMWSIARGREVTLLELELQAEVDKYASALTLLTQQGAGQFPRSLHARLFDRISFLPGPRCGESPAVRRSKPACGALLPIAGRAFPAPPALASGSVAVGVAAVLSLQPPGEDPAVGGVLGVRPADCIGE